jgi:ABC-2 type transport system permease protein
VSGGFSFARVRAVLLKELVQMRRDRLTFAVMVMMPVIQVLLFGFAINTDPRHLPAAVELRDDGPMTRSFLASLRASSFFDIVAVAPDAASGDAMLRAGEVSFLIVVPERFEERMVRGERPQILIAADASDPVAAAGPVAALDAIARSAFAPDIDTGPLATSAPQRAPYEIVAHRRYNPAGVTAFNIVPGLLGVILTMTMVMITSIALTRETERGTMETLLSTPVRPAEIMLGKTTPYVLVALVQVVLVLIAGAFLFHLPFTGDPFALSAALAVFIFTNLMLGYLISTVATTQMQAMQMTFFVFLPSILLSGFMFPFRAMPGWAQGIGEAVPLTHFLRIARAVVLKGGGFPDIARELFTLAAILAIFTVAALLRFRRTL